jgi:hypothetical protein
LIFGNICESPVCEESISKLKIIKSSKLQLLHSATEIFLLSDFADNMCTTPALSSQLKPIGDEGGGAA